MALELWASLLYIDYSDDSTHFFGTVTLTEKNWPRQNVRLRTTFRKTFREFETLRQQVKESWKIPFPIEPSTVSPLHGKCGDYVVTRKRELNNFLQVWCGCLSVNFKRPVQAIFLLLLLLLLLLLGVASKEATVAEIPTLVAWLFLWISKYACIQIQTTDPQPFRSASAISI